MRINTMGRMSLVVLLGAAAAGAVGGEHREPPADPRLEFLKRLAGSWVEGPGAAGQPQTSYEFRVTAGGHAVEEREMIGTPMEMVTLYHMDGGDLVATHYCAMGNQPRLRAAERIVDETLAFTCTGKPGNAASHDDEHVHGWSMRLDGEGRLHYSAELVKAGQVTLAPSVVLTRRQETAGR